MYILKLNYQVTLEEAQEAIACLNYRREGRYREVNIGVLTILGILLLIAYQKRPEQFYLFILLVLDILTLFYLTYGIVYKRKKRAKRIASVPGEYRVVFSEPHICFGDKGQKISMEEHNSCVFVSCNTYTIKAGKELFVIPLRILSGDEQKELERILGKYIRKHIHITIRKE